MNLNEDANNGSSSENIRFVKLCATQNPFDESTTKRFHDSENNEDIHLKIVIINAVQNILVLFKRSV